MVPKQLGRGAAGERICPECGKVLEFVEGEPVRLVNDKLNMEDTESHYICRFCQIDYKPLLRTEYYTAHALKKVRKLRKARAVGELEPMKLVRDANGDCSCPRCGARMRFIEGGPVRIIEGKLNMQDVMDHFVCDECSSVYRRIAGTEYFQWHAE